MNFAGLMRECFAELEKRKMEPNEVYVATVELREKCQLAYSVRGVEFRQVELAHIGTVVRDRLMKGDKVAAVMQMPTRDLLQAAVELAPPVQDEKGNVVAAVKAVDEKPKKKK